MCGLQPVLGDSEDAEVLSFPLLLLHQLSSALDPNLQGDERPFVGIPTVGIPYQTGRTEEAKINCKYQDSNDFFAPLFVL